MFGDLTTFRLRNERAKAPAEVLRNLNEVLCKSGGSGFTTCLCVRVSADGEMTYANAGHLPPYLNGEELPTESGLPLGVRADVRYGERSSMLEQGESLTLISDGVVEARNTRGELFGFERTKEISNQVAEAIANAARQFGQQDDVTVLILSRAAEATLPQHEAAHPAA